MNDVLCLFVYELCVYKKNVSSFKSIKINKIQKKMFKKFCTLDQSHLKSLMFLQGGCGSAVKNFFKLF